MNLCIIQPHLGAASETFIAAHAERLPAKVTVVHGWPPQVGAHPVLAQSLWRRGIRKIYQTAIRGSGSWEDTRAHLCVMRRYRIDAVLAEYGPMGCAVLEACRLRRVPLVVHFHGADASAHAVLNKYRERYQELFQHAAAIVAVSRAMQARLIGLGAPQAKVHYSPCGVDCELFSGANPADSPPVFLAVGRFVEKKGAHLTLLAFAEVFRAHPQSRLRMVGDGPLHGACRQLATALGIDAAVTFLGIQPPSVVSAEMQHVRAFVQHSIEACDGDCEGTPVAVLEAGASGLPVISTRHAGIPDVVLEGQTGLLVPEGDVAGMAQAMLRLCGDAQLAAKLGKTARQRILAEFSMEQSIGRLWSIIANSVHTAASRL